MINQYLYERLVQNGNGNNLGQIFDYSFTVGFMIVNHFFIEKYELWMKFEDDK